MSSQGGKYNTAQRLCISDLYHFKAIDMRCGYFTRILNLGDTEMYCTLVHNESVEGGSHVQPHPIQC
jgi:hypothetical protein